MSEPLRIYRRTFADDETLIVERPEWGPRGLVGRMSIIHREYSDAGLPWPHEYFLGTLSLTDLRERLTLFNILTQMWALTNDPPAEAEDGQPVEEPAATKQSVLWQIGEFFSDILDQENARFSPVRLKDVPIRPVEKMTVDIGNFSLLANHPTTFFGDGESCKSLLALTIAGELAARGRNVLYLDYELQAEDHVERLAKLFKVMPDFHYLRCTAPLGELVPTVKEYCDTWSIDYLVVDSIAPACDVEPERSEAAKNYYSALGDIGVAGSLSIAHRTKTNYDKPGEEKPFGSAFWHNFARETYFVVSDASKKSTDSRGVTLSCRKANLRKLPADTQVDIKFSPGRIDLLWSRTRAAEQQDSLNQAQEDAWDVLYAKGPLDYDSWKKASGMAAGDFSLAFQGLREKKRVTKDGLDWVALD